MRREKEPFASFGVARGGELGEHGLVVGAVDAVLLRPLCHKIQLEIMEKLTDQHSSDEDVPAKKKG